MKPLQMFCTVTLCMMWVLGISTAQAATPDGRILVESFSPRDVADLTAPYVTEVSTGLPNVGVGQKVYLRALPDQTYHAEQVLVSAVWELISKPTGSAATLVSATINDSVMTLTPDSIGQYKIGLTMVTDAGPVAGQQIMWVNAAKFVGVGTIIDESITVGNFKGQCAVCHSNIEDEWQTTNHATVLERKLNLDASKGPESVSTHFSSNCVSCHSTGYLAGSNDGFDDRATAAGWVFPTLGAGAFDSLKNNYPEVAKMANVQCESCHGPGSDHMARLDKNQIAKSLQSGACETCHNSGSHHYLPNQWSKSAHAHPAYLNRSGGCEACHTGSGFFELTVQKVASTAPYDDPAPISCPVCHDPHSNENNNHQVRLSEDPVTLLNGVVVTKGGDGKLCMNCHHSRVDIRTYVATTAGSNRFGPHYGPQTDMLSNTGAVEFGHVIGGTSHMTAIGNLCVTCHMAEPPDEKFDIVGQHTYKVAALNEAGEMVEHVEVCQQCHGADIEEFTDIKATNDHDGDGTVEGAIEEVEGLMEQLAMLLPPVGQPTVAITSAYTKTQLASAFNYKFVEEDRSGGVHNAGYSINILKLAIQNLSTGDVGATNVTVKDMPNDQGKQVRVQWTQFAGDGAPTNPIQEYGVWRRADALGKAAAAVTVESRDALWKAGTSAETGQVFAAPDGVWEYMARVPSAGLQQYGAVVASLADSNASGIRYSAFHVTGHFADGVVVHSEVDSGYSVDNIQPSVPKVAAAQPSAGKVTVTLELDTEDPLNQDFAYFCVYRGITEDFTPSETNEYARISTLEFTDNVNTGQLFYYVFSAVDINGNESDLSVVATSSGNIVTGIEELSGLPTSYMLTQNYPNPFNPVTTIKFGLPVAGHTELTIFNLQGIPVRTLLNDVLPAGFSTVQWDGRDEFGMTVASGVYIYRIQSRNFASSKKMVLLK